MDRWGALIISHPQCPAYHMRPDDAWGLPLPEFMALSDAQRKMFRKANEQ